MNKKLYKKFGYFNQEEINNAFLDECGNGNVKNLEYLLHSKDLQCNAKNFSKLSSVLEAVQNGHIDVVKYLVENTYLKNDYKPYVQHKYVLDAIRIREDVPMIQYLIFELNIDKTEYMQSFLNNANTAYRNAVAKLYDARDLKNGLITSLSEKDTPQKKPKI